MFSMKRPVEMPRTGSSVGNGEVSVGSPTSVWE